MIDPHDIRRTVLFLEEAQMALDAAMIREERRERGKIDARGDARKLANAAREHVRDMKVKYKIETGDTEWFWTTIKKQGADDASS